MKNLVIYGLVLFLLALNCMAVSPVQLTGSSGKVVLDSLGVNNSSQASGALAGNTSNLTGNNSLENLWSWAIFQRDIPWTSPESWSRTPRTRSGNQAYETENQSTKIFGYD